MEDSRATEVTTPRAFEVALTHIEGLILEGQISVGDKLPAERDLASQLNISRPAVREAIRTLEAQGVIASRVGSGARSGTHVINERSQALARLLRLQVALAQFPLNEVMTTRIVLERSSCQLAAQQADDQGLATLADITDAMDDQHDHEHFNQLDTEFHVTIARLGGNRLMGDLASAIRESLRLPILAAERQMAEWPRLREHFQTGHRAIQQALCERDGDLAADAMEEHIRSAYSLLPIKLPSSTEEWPSTKGII